MTSAAETNPSAVSRVALWCGRRRRWVSLAWLLIVVAAIATCSTVGTNTEIEQEAPGESGVAFALFEDRFAGDDDENAQATTTEFLTFSHPTLTVDDPGYRATVERLISEIGVLRTTVTRTSGETSVTSSMRIVADAVTHYDTGLPREASPFVAAEGTDGDVSFAIVEIVGQDLDAAEAIGPVLDVVAAADGIDGFEIFIGGGASLQRQLTEIIDEDFGRALTLNLPLTLVILIFVMGALLIAPLPIVLALIAITTATAIIALISQLTPVAEVTAEVVLLMGLATGIDYSLFIVTRYRRERSHGVSNEQALQIATGTSGKTVIFAGATVVLSISGMLLVNDAIFTSIAIGSAVVVTMAVIISMTLLPALLLFYRGGVDRLRIPFLAREGDDGGIWGRISDQVLARPVLFATVATVALLALAAPVVTLNLGFNGVKSISKDAEATRALRVLEENFTLGLVQPAVVLIDAGEGGNVFAPEIQQSAGVLAALVAEESVLRDPGGFFGPITQEPVFNDAGDLEVIFIPINADSGEDFAIDAVEHLRDDLVPAAFGDGSANALVTGATAGNIDFRANIISSAPIVFAFVLSLAFIILLVMFRSIVIPVKAILLNLLSVGAAYGLLVLVFQEGWLLEGVLSFEATGIIESWLPLFMFAILFGLSMDYHMFVLGRMKESYEGGASNDEAVSVGIKATAATITGAAAIMVGVFSIFAFTRDIGLKQFGFGLGVAILIDATIIRSILLPASMKLLGDANWYLPRWLEWLPKIEMSE